MSDLNFPNIDWKLYSSASNDSISSVFLNSIFDVNLFQSFYQLTRGNNILDLILSNPSDNIDNVMVCEPISDHCLICPDSDFDQTIEISQTPKEYIRGFAHGDYEVFNAYLQGINWYEVFTEAINVNSRWVALTSIINA